MSASVPWSLRQSTSASGYKNTLKGLRTPTKGVLSKDGNEMPENHYVKREIDCWRMDKDAISFDFAAGIVVSLSLKLGLHVRWSACCSAAVIVLCVLPPRQQYKQQSAGVCFGCFSYSNILWWIASPALVCDNMPRSRPLDLEGPSVSQWFKLKTINRMCLSWHCHLGTRKDVEIVVDLVQLPW